LAKFANLYEKLNKDLDAEESAYPSATPRTEENQGDKGKESPLSEL
jgi:hypothetical protein